MANVREIARRITTVRNLAQVTRAMQMVSASRMRKAQERVLAARPYATKTTELLRQLAAAQDQEEVGHRLLDCRPVERVAMVVIASDRGLCGSYNTNVIRAALRYAKGLKASVGYVAVGVEARRSILAAGGDLLAEFEGIPAELTVQFAGPIARLLETAFLSGEIDAGLVAYTEFGGALTQVPTVTQVVPILPPGGEAGALPTRRRQGGGSLQYTYEPSAASILERLLPHAVEVQVFGYLLESAASEHSARMVAMRNATKSAQDHAESLTRAFNRARQTAITSEILDIASATEALHAG